MPVLVLALALLGLPLPAARAQSVGPPAPIPFGVGLTQAVGGDQPASLVDSMVVARGVTRVISIPYFWFDPTTRQVVSCSTSAGLISLARSLGFTTMIRFETLLLGEVVAPPVLGAQTFSNPELVVAFVEEVRCLASLGVDYIVLGPEVTFAYLFDPAEFEAFAAAYRQAYEAAHGESPSVRVGASYHFEFMLWFDAWQAALSLGPQDFYGFTHYFAVTPESFEAMPDPYAVPVDYFAPIRERLGFDTPVVFTEYAWSSHFGLSAADAEDRQARLFLVTPELMAAVEPELVVAAALHDIGVFGGDVEAINRSGLIYSDGTPKLAWYYLSVLMSSGVYAATTE